MKMKDEATCIPKHDSFSEEQWTVGFVFLADKIWLNVESQKYISADGQLPGHGYLHKQINHS